MKTAAETQILRVAPAAIGEDVPLKNRETVLLDGQDTWGVYRSPKIVSVAALGPCLGVIVYSPREQKALAGHLGPASSKNRQDDHNFCKFLKALEQDFLIPGDLAIFLGGQCVSRDVSDEGKATTRANQQSVAPVFIAYGLKPERIYTRWSRSDALTQEMIIDLKSGNVNYLETLDYEESL